MIFILLENIRSVHNVGSIFRTADARGVKKIYLCGNTPCPLDRFGNKRKDFHKVALGAEESVEWEYLKDSKEVLGLLEKDCEVISVEQDKNSVSLYDFKPQKKNQLYVLGNEVDGVSDEILKNSDAILEIPMFGEKESLNVSVTAGIVLFSNMKQSQ